jgi:hypothetical protein
MSGWKNIIPTFQHSSIPANSERSELSSKQKKVPGEKVFRAFYRIVNAFVAVSTTFVAPGTAFWRFERINAQPNKKNGTKKMGRAK